MKTKTKCFTCGGDSLRVLQNADKTKVRVQCTFCYGKGPWISASRLIIDNELFIWRAKEAWGREQIALRRPLNKKVA